jgi:plastocyanin
MKFSTAVSLGLAPVALAKAVNNVYPGKRDNKKSSNNGGGLIGGGVSVNSVSIQSISVSSDEQFLLDQVVGQQAEIQLLEEALLLWVNPGLNAATTIINPQATATAAVGGQTVVNGGTTVVAGAGTATVAAGATGTVAATGATHSVTVGGAAGLAYSPASIQAAVGDTVIFTFMSQNHTATQSAFTTPCDALAGGMDSGFQPNANNSVNPPPQVAMQVQVATPLCKRNTLVWLV